MSEQTLTRADLADAVYEQVGLSRSESSDLVDETLDLMIDGLVADDLLKISSFGTFQVRQKKARVGRNPKTGVEVTITPRRVVTYKASHVLKNRINEGK
jgi:integration host factor subunit alpha